MRIGWLGTVPAIQAMPRRSIEGDLLIFDRIHLQLLQGLEIGVRQAIRHFPAVRFLHRPHHGTEPDNGRHLGRIGAARRCQNNMSGEGRGVGRVVQDAAGGTLHTGQDAGIGHGLGEIGRRLRRGAGRHQLDRAGAEAERNKIGGGNAFAQQIDDAGQQRVVQPGHGAVPGAVAAALGGPVEILHRRIAGGVHRFHQRGGVGRGAVRGVIVAEEARPQTVIVQRNDQYTDVLATRAP